MRPAPAPDSSVRHCPDRPPKCLWPAADVALLNHPANSIASGSDFLPEDCTMLDSANMKTQLKAYLGARGPAPDRNHRRSWMAGPKSKEMSEPSGRHRRAVRQASPLRERPGQHGRARAVFLPGRAPAMTFRITLRRPARWATNSPPSMLALLQVGGYPPKVEEAVIEQVKALARRLRVRNLSSPQSCHNCPDVVQALNLMAVLNPRRDQHDDRRRAVPGPRQRAPASWPCPRSSSTARTSARAA